MTLVFTDSGLGGLSVMAEFIESCPQAGMFERIVFFNALYQNGMGYNTMKTQEEKIRIFDRALFAMDQQFNPVFIAIACNTLSALFPSTAFFSRRPGKGISIVSTGRSMIQNYRQEKPDIPIWVVATPITIRSGIYQFETGDIQPWAADGLASAIETDIHGIQVRETIATLFHHIRQHDPITRRLALFLGCTHFGYAAPLFLNQAAEFELDIDRILDPNSAFAHNLASGVPQTADSPRLAPPNLQIYSRTEIPPHEKLNMINLIRPLSPRVASALDHYTLNPDLF
ncbi:MAG: aspartate/glutamate racemase family protein [Candidatus Delongbacteria bacterium]|nr:aspartate/glutamate racemase family protein [Candidatus Delongbacteria bacterium]